MRLQVARALVGEPEQGDRVLVTFESGTGLRLRCEPHVPFRNFIWRVEQDHLSEAVVEQIGQRVRDTRLEKCYVDYLHVIAVGHDLHLIRVPRGNQASLKRFTSNSRIEHIDINV